MALSEHQRRALDEYEKLMAERPALFQGRARRPIVRDFGVLAEYAASHRDVVLGVAADTPYVTFVVDLVEAGGAPGPPVPTPYLRLVSRGQLDGAVNVVIVATIANPDLGRVGDIVLVEQERHALGTDQVELPRGFGQPGEDGTVSALRELREETGYQGDRAAFLGRTHTDSGITDDAASFYLVQATSRTDPSPEAEETIRRVFLASPQDVWRDILAGTVQDAFTLQGMALLDRRREEQAPNR